MKEKCCQFGENIFYECFFVFAMVTTTNITKYRVHPKQMSEQEILEICHDIRDMSRH